MILTFPIAASSKPNASRLSPYFGIADIWSKYAA